MVKFIKKSELNACEREACRALYKEGFPEDSDEYVEWFLDNKEYIVALNDEHTSALYLVTKRIRMHGKNLDVTYIVAFSAAKSARGKGVAAEVMNAAIEYEREKGTPFVFLSPFNYEYYLQYGFQNVDRVLTSIDKPDYERVKITDSVKGGEVMFKVRGIVGEKFDIAQIADANELSERFNEEITGGAEFYALILNDGSIYGYELEARGRIYERYTLNMRRTRKPHVQARIASIESALKSTRLNTDFIALGVKDGDDINYYNLVNNGGELIIRTMLGNQNDLDNLEIVTISELTALLLTSAPKSRLNNKIPSSVTVMFDRY